MAVKIGEKYVLEREGMDTIIHLCHKCESREDCNGKEYKLQGWCYTCKECESA